MKTFLKIICLLFSILSDCALVHGQDDFLPDERVRLVFLGDIFLGNWAEEFLRKYGVDYPFRGCADLLTTADLAIANLEAPITAGGVPFPDKEFLLKMPPGSQIGLAEANIRCLNLANNHIMDYGGEGLAATFKSLDSSNIKYFGAGENLDSACREAVFDLKGKTFAFIGFSTVFPQEFWATDTTPGTAFPWKEKLAETISRCRENYDFIIVSFHWSAELRDVPKDYQVELAHLCVDSGADIVVGHHPHIPQGIEFYKGKPIFYSLGNFAFASYSENAVQAMAAVVDFPKTGGITVRIVPLNVYNSEVNFRPQPLTGKKKADFFRRLRALSKELNTENIVITDTGEIKVSPIMEGASELNPYR